MLVEIVPMLFLCPAQRLAYGTVVCGLCAGCADL